MPLELAGNAAQLDAEAVLQLVFDLVRQAGEHLRRQRRPHRPGNDVPSHLPAGLIRDAHHADPLPPRPPQRTAGPRDGQALWRGRTAGGDGQPAHPRRHRQHDASLGADAAARDPPADGTHRPADDADRQPTHRRSRLRPGHGRLPGHVRHPLVRRGTGPEALAGGCWTSCSCRPRPCRECSTARLVAGRMLPQVAAQLGLASQPEVLVGLMDTSAACAARGAGRRQPVQHCRHDRRAGALHGQAPAAARRAHATGRHRAALVRDQHDGGGGRGARLGPSHVLRRPVGQRSSSRWSIARTSAPTGKPGRAGRPGLRRQPDAGPPALRADPRPAAVDHPRGDPGGAAGEPGQAQPRSAADPAAPDPAERTVYLGGGASQAGLSRLWPEQYTMQILPDDASLQGLAQLAGGQGRPLVQ